MVRLTDTSAIVFDWLNGDVRTLRQDYARVRAKPVPPEATWRRIGAEPNAVPVLCFPGDGQAIPYGTLTHRLAPRFSPWGEDARRADEGLREARSKRLGTPHPAFGHLLPKGRSGSLPRPTDKREATTAIVYFHGGGFIVGSPVTHADIAARLAHHSGLPVYSVDYRLAPDHKAPAPMEDGIAVIRHLIASGVAQLAICGDSAGGAIALGTEAALPDDLRGHVVAVASFYGAHGLLDSVSLRERGNRTDGTDRACVARYFELAGRDAYAIETLAKLSTVHVYLIAAEEDALRDDTLALAQAMQEQGREVIVDRVPGVGHGFLHGGEANAAAEGALARFAGWLSARTTA